MVNVLTGGGQTNQVLSVDIARIKSCTVVERELRSINIGDREWLST